MRIYTPNGDLQFSTFIFPDGQPHFKLETHALGSRLVTMETAIKSPVDLLEVVMVADVLREYGYTEIVLDIRYLMGARMDRAIDPGQPLTLAVVARILNGCGFSKVRILDVHSEVAVKLIRNSVNVLPFLAVQQVIAMFPSVTIVVPDKGAVDRVMAISRPAGYCRNVLFCTKERDSQTGVLTGFKVVTPPDSAFGALIIDDICDGGGTFVGLAKELRAAGAKKVYLYVTHGIFSKGLPLDGIDKVFTTDSYCDGNFGYVPVVPVTILPVSMKEM